MAYTTATLEGTYQTTDGDPAQGVIEIIPNSRALIDPEGNVILSGRVKVKLGHAAAEGEEGADADGWVHDGQFSVTLPSTDDATVEPATGRQYAVSAKLKHTRLAAVAGIELAGGETVDMADVTPAAEAAATFSVWLTEEEYAAVVARVADLEAAPAVTKASLGLGSVDNTSDAAKPISTATQAAFNGLSATYESNLRPSLRVPRPNLTVIDPMESGWTIGGGGTNTGASSAANAGDAFLGAASTKVVSLGTTGFSYTEKAGFTLDMTGKQFVFMLKLPSMTHAHHIDFIVGNNGLTSYFQGTVYPSLVGVYSRFVHDGEWAVITVPWSMFTTTVGTPNRAALTTVRFVMVDNESGTDVTWLYGGVATMPEPAAYPNGVVSLTFDDSFGSLMTEAAPRLGRRGWPGTAFIDLSSVGGSGRPSLADYVRLKRIGWDVAGHTPDIAGHTDYQVLTSAQRLALLKRVKDGHAALGLHTDIFAYPLNRADVATETDVSTMFSAARGIGETVETVPPAKPSYLRAITCDSVISLATFQAFVDKAKSGKAHAIFMFHDIVASGATGQAINAAMFQSMLDYINTQGVPVRSLYSVLSTPAT